jgi:predicted signal transduction protein with EAL and GGDEF domain
MAFLILGIASILLIIAYIIIQREGKKCAITAAANNFIVRQSRINIALSMGLPFFVIIQWALFLLKTNNDLTPIVTLVFIPLFLICSLPVVMWLRWKITVKDNQITYTPYFGRKKTFAFDYITTVKCGIKVEITRYRVTAVRNYIKAYHEKKKLFYLLDTSNGYQALVSLLKDKGVPFERDKV